MTLWPRLAQAAASTKLREGATVAVVGGGPAGAFFAIHLLSLARSSGIRLDVVIFERRSKSDAWVQCLASPGWTGCNNCAGGISPKLHDLLESLELRLPDTVIQGRVHRVVIQGFWKNIELEVPPERSISTVFRGSRPACFGNREQSFDRFLLNQAVRAGARVVEAEVRDVKRSSGGKPRLVYGGNEGSMETEADMVVFAVGSKDGGCSSAMMGSIKATMPRFVAPRTRRTLIFELQAIPDLPVSIRDTITFVEYGSKELSFEMSSLVPKRQCVTVVLVGRCVDRLRNLAQGQDIIRKFLNLPHVQRLFSPAASLNAVCLCSPFMVVGSARHPFADRAAAVGDLVTTRLYKDGILSAEQTAAALAKTILERGVDEKSLRQGYTPILRRFTRNNRIAAIVFLLHRFFFGSSVLSRIVYQAVITERKTTPAARRNLEQILWRIASGDDEYGNIFRHMLRPATLWSIVTGGAILTLRNYLTELAFGLKWQGFGRYTTGVTLERLQEKRRQFASLAARARIEIPAQLEFERMYTIKIGAPTEMILEELEKFGEPDRAYLRPRGIKISRISGLPHEPGCTIRYEVLSSRLTFELRLEQVMDGHLAVYRVMTGFARGGVLLFEIEPSGSGICLLSIYVAFNFPRAQSGRRTLFWNAFKHLFPAFIHDVIWNHSLCHLRDLVETKCNQRTGSPQPFFDAHI